MLYHYLKIAFKHIKRQRLISIINIGGLSIGIASFLLIVLWINREISYDRFYENADRIHRVAFYYPPLDINAYKQPGALPQHLTDNFEEITLASHLQEGEFKLSYNGHGFFAHCNTVEPEFLSIFSFPVIKGNPEKFLSEPNSIVLTESLSKKIFGDEDPLNKFIIFNDHANFKVAGILEDLPGNTHLNFEFLIPFNQNDESLRSWNYKNGDSYVMLSENADLASINQKIRPIIDQIKPEWNNKLFLQPLLRDHLYPIQGMGAITYIYVFSTIAIIILLIACINFMNLTIAQAEKRQKEIGVKKAAGSSRKQLAMQFFTESFLSVILAALISLLIVEILVPIINLQLGFSLAVEFSWLMIICIISVILISGFVSGSYPALHLSSMKTQHIFKLSSGKSSSAVLMRKILVVCQFTLSIVFIIAVLTTQRQSNFLKQKNLGYDKENLLLVQARGEMRNKLPQLKQKLLEHHQISSVSVSSNNLFNVMNSGPLDFPGKIDGTDDEYIEFWYNWVDEDFLNTMGLDLVEGQFFSKDKPSGLEEGFIVNETAIKAMQLDDPIGKPVSAWFDQKGSIIGVVKDYHISSLHIEIQPMVLLYAESNNYLLVKIKPGDLQKSIQLIGKSIHEIVPDDPFNYHFIDETISQQYQLETRSGNLMKLSAILAIVISSLGLFSLSAQTIEKRNKEIGIRKVNGASTSSIMALLNKEFLILVVISFAIAAPLSWYLLQKWLSEFAYKINISLWVYAFAGCIAFVIALCTVSWHSWKAARRNPTDVLRYE